MRICEPFLPKFKLFLQQRPVHDQVIYETFFVDPDLEYIIAPGEAKIVFKLIEDFIDVYPLDKGKKDLYGSWALLYHGLKSVIHAEDNEPNCAEALRKLEVVQDNEQSFLNWVVEHENLAKSLLDFCHKIDMSELLAEFDGENYVIKYFSVSQDFALLMENSHFPNVLNFLSEHSRARNRFVDQFMSDEEKQERNDPNDLGYDSYDHLDFDLTRFSNNYKGEQPQ